MYAGEVRRRGTQARYAGEVRHDVRRKGAVRRCKRREPLRVGQCRSEAVRPSESHTGPYRAYERDEASGREPSEATIAADEDSQGGGPRDPTRVGGCPPRGMRAGPVVLAARKLPQFQSRFGGPERAENGFLGSFTGMTFWRSLKLAECLPSPGAPWPGP